MSTISLSHVGFSYGISAEPVFSDVSLNISNSARVVLVGANGAGKSTLLRLIAGRRRSTAGHARVLGEDAFEHTQNCLRVNLVTDDWDADLTLPVRQLVAAAAGASGVAASRVARLLEVLGVAELLGAELHELSDGQRRRVQLFCKLLPERELVLLDEATNSLDVLARASLLAFLREESEARGCTVVFCTHIFDGLDGWATDVAHLDGGRLRRHVSAASLPADQSLYHTISAWMLEHGRESRERRAAAMGGEVMSYEAIARDLLAAAADGSVSGEAKELVAPSTGKGAADADEFTTSPPKRNRPASPEPERRAAGTALPEGWGSRASTLEEGGFGAHQWAGSRPAGVVESLPRAATAPSATAEASAPAPPPAPPEAPAAPVAEEPAPAVELPPAAQRLAPALQAALAMLNTRVSACSTAVGKGDAGTVAAEAAAVAAIWAQAERALKQFNQAMGGVVEAAPQEVRPSPPVPAPAGDGGGGSTGGSGGLPEGWGSRNTARSEAELVRLGIIPPPTTLSGEAPPAPR